MLGSCSNAMFGVPQVMINDRNRHVEIYLHLKTPAMVMGEVIMENPSRPGSAAAATPLRWERHLAIGCDCIGDTVRMASLCGGLFLKLVLTDHSLARRVIGRLSQRCTQGTLFCYAPVRTYCPDVVVGRWTVEVLVGILCISFTGALQHLFSMMRKRDK